jgi:TadE-like protein
MARSGHGPTAAVGPRSERNDAFGATARLGEASRSAPPSAAKTSGQHHGTTPTLAGSVERARARAWEADMSGEVDGRRRASGDDGTALVEFAFIMNILFLFLYGIIGFGLLLSFRQNLVQSAAEGARAGAVAPNTPPGNPTVAALTAVSRSVDQYGRTCGTPALTCVAQPAPCDPPPATVPECMTVTLTYHYDVDPLLPQIPIISQFLPDEIKVSSTAQMNPAPPPTP